MYFIELTQPSSITLLIFKNNKENLTLSKGDNIEIIGEIDEYEGKLEVIGNRIRVIS